MRIIFDVGHPAHVHLYRNTITELTANGEHIKIIARKREITYHLLDKYGLNYIKFPQVSKSMTNPISLIGGINKLSKIAKVFKPDMFVSSGSILSAQVSSLISKPHIVFGDTVAKKYSPYYFTSYLVIAPFTNVFCTPSVLNWKPIRNVRYHGYHELAYLHPNWFKPDPEVLDIANLSKHDKFIIVRFASWDAVHDVGQKMIFNSIKERVEFINKLERFGKILITSEIPLPDSLKKYKLPIPPEKLHSLLYYSSMYIGEGATLASEAGVLGIPWIWLCGTEKLDYLVDQEDNYDLGYNIFNYQKALNKVKEIFDNYSNIKQEWQKRRKRLLRNKIDVTAFMVWFLTNYPKSYEIMKKNPNYDEKFK